MCVVRKIPRALSFELQGYLDLDCSSTYFEQLATRGRASQELERELNNSFDLKDTCNITFHSEFAFSTFCVSLSKTESIVNGVWGVPVVETTKMPEA